MKLTKLNKKRPASVQFWKNYDSEYFSGKKEEQGN